MNLYEIISKKNSKNYLYVLADTEECAFLIAKIRYKIKPANYNCFLIYEIVSVNGKLVPTSLIFAGFVTGYFTRNETQEYVSNVIWYKHYELNIRKYYLDSVLKDL